MVVLPIVIAAAGSVPASASEVCKLPQMRVDSRPDPEGVPTKVSVAIWLLDLLRIDDIEQNMSVDLLVIRSWRDRRLEGLGSCRFELNKIWSPRIDFLNSGRVFPGLPENVRIGNGGMIEYRQRYRGLLSFPHKLDRFPFDSHTLRIAMATTDYVESEVTLVADANYTGRRKGHISIPDWAVGTPTGHVGPYTVPGLGRTFSTYRYDLPVSRLPEYFIWKVIIPLVLIVAMSWTVFWISPVHFGPQIGLSATSMLTLIAFQFATTSLLPKLNYFTLLDRFVTLSTVMVFLGLLESLTTTYLVTLDKKELGIRIDRVCRWAFPLAFAVMVAIIFAYR